MSETPSGPMQHAEPGNQGRDAATDSRPLHRGHAGTAAGGRGDVFSEHCASREVLRHVTGRWGVLLLVALLDGTQRFGGLRRRVGGISEKMLAQTLVWLEQDGLVQRIVRAGTASHVEYRLTPLGEQLGRKAGDLVDWIESKLPDILAAQREVVGDAEDADGANGADLRA